MDKFVYLAGPIGGCTQEEATYWRDYATERFAPNVVGISPMRDKATLGSSGGKISASIADYGNTLMSNGLAIYTRDRYDCINADMVLCYLPAKFNSRRPSLGTVMELGWANGAGVPIVLVSDDPTYYNHPLLHHGVQWRLDNLDDAIYVVNAFLGAYSSKEKSIVYPEVVKLDEPPTQQLRYA